MVVPDFTAMRNWYKRAIRFQSYLPAVLKLLSSGLKGPIPLQIIVLMNILPVLIVVMNDDDTSSDDDDDATDDDADDNTTPITLYHYSDWQG